MEFTITKEFIIEAHKAACSDWKNRIEKEFPEVFDTKLEIGKWYKGSEDFPSLIYTTKLIKRSYYNIIHYYGFTHYKYSVGNTIANFDHEKSLVEATDKEVEEALIAEGGYKKGSKTKCLVSHKEVVLTSEPYYSGGRINCKTESLPSGYAVLFMDGEFAEILPEEKTVITKEKALKILAKQYNTTPENIEIK